MFPEDRRQREGGGEEQHLVNSFKELLVSGWCPTAAAVRNWVCLYGFCISMSKNANTCMYLFTYFSSNLLLSIIFRHYIGIY